MIRALAFLAIALVTSVSQAATVKFSGTYNLVVGPDVLNIAGKQFLATLVTNDGPVILNGDMWLAPASPAHTQNFGLVGGTVTLGPANNTTFSGISAGGGTLLFQIGQLAAGFSQADLNAIVGVSGSSTWVVGGTVYSSTITAVPEPGSMLALAGLVVGCAGVRYRRRRLATAA